MRRYSFALVAVLFALSLGAQAEAKPKARKSKRGVAGKVLTSNKRFSSRMSRARVWKQAKKNFWEDRKTKKWTIHYAAFFRRPLNDLEVTVKLIDITTKPHHLVAVFEQFLATRGQRAVYSKLVMRREQFGVNRRILMTVEDYRGRVLAEGTFKIGGKVNKKGRNRTIVFTEDETK